MRYRDWGYSVGELKNALVIKTVRLADWDLCRETSDAARMGFAVRTA
jgi:hypothetical protein